MPQTIIKPLREKLLDRVKEDETPTKVVSELRDFGWETPDQIDTESLTPKDKQKLKRRLSQMMNKAAKEWRFEEAARLRDTIEKLS